MTKAKDIEQDDLEALFDLPRLVNIASEKIILLLTCAFPSSAFLLSWVTYSVTASYLRAIIVFLLCSLPACYRVFKSIYRYK